MHRRRQYETFTAPAATNCSLILTAVASNPYSAARDDKIVTNDGEGKDWDGDDFSIYFKAAMRLRFLLGAFAKLRQAIMSFVMSVCLSIHIQQLGSY
jgi:hypothetical protein